MKVLWVGDSIVQSGFSIVTHNICNELHKKCDLVVYGIRYDGITKNPYPYYIYPAYHNGDIYSFNLLEKVIKEEKPDVIVIFNDDHIIEQYLRVIGNCDRVVPLFPVNLLPLDRNKILNYSSCGISEVMTYTDFSKKNVLEINPNLNVTSIYHGVHKSVFYSIPDAKLNFGLEDIFIVGNVNSNTYRKRLDLFLKGFAKFAEGKSDVKCLIHASNKDMAYNLPTIVSDLGLEDKTILSLKPREFDEMNTLYNMMDINVNTSMGEGFGLSLLEGAVCGVPIICSEHGNLKDIWTKGVEFIKIRENEYIAGSKFIGGVIDTDDFADKLNLFYENRFTNVKRLEVVECSNGDQFQWGTVADKVYKVLRRASGERISYFS